jgi:hypothetical protein
MCFEMKNILKNNNHYHTFKHNKKKKLSQPRETLPNYLEHHGRWLLAISYLSFIYEKIPTTHPSRAKTKESR